MSSIRDVAKEAGVSIATVSRVINGSDMVSQSMRQHVLNAVRACNYTPALGHKSLDMIALIYTYTGPFRIGSFYESACLEGMVEVMRESPYDLRIVDIHRDVPPHEKMSQFFMRKNIAGAIVHCTIEDRPTVVKMAKEDLPIVVLGDHFDCSDECSNLSFVYSDSKQASCEAVEHLVSLGHKRIAFAGTERDDGDHLDRLHAYRKTLEENGLLDESLIYRVPPQRLNGPQLVRNLLGRLNRPTAIFIADPPVAIGVMNEAYRLGVRIPGDLSIIGFDDTNMRNYVYPTMSAVCQDTKALSRSAFRLLLNRIERTQDECSNQAQHPAWLDLGGTTSSPPHNPQRVLMAGNSILFDNHSPV